MSTSFANCPRCDEHTRLRTREFSDQAISALVAWEEVETHMIGKPMCSPCYDELREVLIDRADDLMETTAKPDTKSKKKRKAG